MRVTDLHKIQRERRNQLAEKENRLKRTLLTIRENSQRALQQLGVVGTLHEALLLVNTDICAELESANPKSVYTRTAISQLRQATDSVQQSKEVIEVWDCAIQELVDTQNVAFHANMNATQTVTKAYDENASTENLESKANFTTENETREHTQDHINCAYCKSALGLQRAVGFGICTDCAKVSCDESWEVC
jgi:hypothetical protein